MKLGQQVIKREEALGAKRLPWDSWWQELGEHVQPRKAQVTERYDHGAPEKHDVARLYDQTALNANQTLANGQMSNITPMGSQWFMLAPPEKHRDDKEVVQWFHDASQRLARALARSNFYSAMDEFYLDRGGFGTAAILCRMGRKGTLVFEELTIGSYSIAEDEERMVDTLYRSYRMTPSQIVKMFGEEAPADMHEKAKDTEKRDVPEEVVHGIEPRYERDPKKMDAKNMAVRSVYVLKESQEVLMESGYYESPFAVSRWRLWGESPYGWSPSWYALPTVDQLNFLEQCIDVGVERAAFPAWLVPATMQGEFDPRPHGQNIYDPRGLGGDNGLPRELESRARLDYGVERAEQKREQIREAFFEDLFRLLSRRDKTMTAREVTELSAEKASMFHPFFARLTTEMLEPILKRAFAEMLRAGQFPSPPQQLFEKNDAGGYEMEDPEISFISRLAMTLQMNETTALMQTFEALAPMAELDPAIMDFINTAKAGPTVARALGVSSDIIRSQEEIEEIAAARQQAQQQAAAMEGAEQASKAVANVGGIDKAKELIPEQG